MVTKPTRFAEPLSTSRSLRFGLFSHVNSRQLQACASQRARMGISWHKQGFHRHLSPLAENIFAAVKITLGVDLPNTGWLHCTTDAPDGGLHTSPCPCGFHRKTPYQCDLSSLPLFNRMVMLHVRDFTMSCQAAMPAGSMP